MDFSNLSADIKELLLLLASLLLFFLLGLFLKWVLFRILNWYGQRTDSLLVDSAVRNLSKPSAYFIPLLFVFAALPLVPQLLGLIELGIAASKIQFMQLTVEIFLYITGAWMIIETTDIFSDIIRERFAMEKADNLEERKIITQLQFIKRLVTVVVALVALAFILFQFDEVRELGMGLLTSAGVAGIIIGLAAQKSIANLLAGFQIAFTQPIRIDDVVIVEGEWGRIEEITLTYVIVRIWDERRLVVPLRHFIEKAFQNWTRNTSQLLGTVYLYTDYRLPMDPLRKELDRLLEENDLWDGRVSKIQVTDSKQDNVEVRALMSAANASDAWDLRCDIREQLIAFIQKEYPESLPRTRIEMPDSERSHAVSDAS